MDTSASGARTGGPGIAIPGRPRYRLTPQAPYQQTPEAWLDAYEGTWNAGPGVDQIWWRLPATFPTEFISGCNATFLGVPAGRAVVTLSLEVWPVPDATGTIVVDVGAHRTEVPVAAAGGRTIEIPFTHDGADSLLAMLLFRQGLYDVVFHAVTLGQGSLVVAPEPPARA
jgi:hypothetical protein